MNDTTKREGFSLDRWSRRKHAATRGEAAPPPSPASATDLSRATPAVAPAVAAPTVVAASPVPAAEPPTALPPIESLTPQSDFTAFMRPEVDESLKRAALKKLFADPHFNVMDGLDIYIDDYSKPDPIPPDMLARLLQNRALFDPPRTRVNAEGVVEEIPDEEVPGAAATVAADAPAPPSVVDAGSSPDSIDGAPADTQSVPVDRSIAESPDGPSR